MGGVSPEMGDGGERDVTVRRKCGGRRERHEGCVCSRLQRLANIIRDSVGYGRGGGGWGRVRMSGVGDGNGGLDWDFFSFHFFFFFAPTEKVKCLCA